MFPLLNLTVLLLSLVFLGITDYGTLPAVIAVVLACVMGVGWRNILGPNTTPKSDDSIVSLFFAAIASLFVVLLPDIAAKSCQLHAQELVCRLSWLTAVDMRPIIVYGLLLAFHVWLARRDEHPESMTHNTVSLFIAGLTAAMVAFLTRWTFAGRWPYMPWMLWCIVFLVCFGGLYWMFNPRKVS